MKLIDSIVSSTDEIRRIRRDLHAHPELRFEEERTSLLVASTLQQWGIQVTRGIGGHSVVGIIQKGSGSGSVGLRTDMDALPIYEKNTFPHASKFQGKMHACGHDGHTAMLLGAARHLVRYGNFDGTVYLIFQPAEEGGGCGADLMIKDRLFEKYPMPKDAIRLFAGAGPRIQSPHPPCPFSAPGK